MILKAWPTTPVVGARRELNSPPPFLLPKDGFVAPDEFLNLPLTQTLK